MRYFIVHRGVQPIVIAQDLVRNHFSCIISHILLIPILNVNPRFIHSNDTKNASVVRPALRRVVEVSVQQTGRTPTPVRVSSDYELAILRALSNVFSTGEQEAATFILAW